MYEEIVRKIGEQFRTFGGGQQVAGNPIAEARKDEPFSFAADVSVAEVVESVLEEVGFAEMLQLCKDMSLLADVAISATPTGEVRNRMTEINILRMDAVATAVKARGTLNKADLDDLVEQIREYLACDADAVDIQRVYRACR